MSTKMKAATLDQLGFAARVQGVILPLLGTSKAIRRYEKELRDAGGTTKAVAEKQMKSFANQMKVLKNQFTVVGIEIGSILAPMLLKLNKIFKKGIDFWRSLSPEVKRVIVTIGLVAGAIAPLLLIFGAFASAIGAIVTGLVVIATHLPAVLYPQSLPL
jgi:TP901 family phage tail tape measure protein